MILQRLLGLSILKDEEKFFIKIHSYWRIFSKTYSQFSDFFTSFFRTDPDQELITFNGSIV
ncbi:hypothetical protein SHPE106448_01510 [Shewanella pealeana]